MKIIKNKRGDIPITILVIGIIGVCILTLFSFANSAQKGNKTFVGSGLIETIYSIQEEMRFDLPYDTFSKLTSSGGFVSIQIDGENINGFYSLPGDKKTLVEIKYKPIK